MMFRGQFCNGAEMFVRAGYGPAGVPKNSSVTRARRCGSSTPHSSRAECMDSSGTPTSTVRMPSRVAVSGPMVEPQGITLLETNSW